MAALAALAARDGAPHSLALDGGRAASCAASEDCGASRKHARRAIWEETYLSCVMR